MKNPNPFRRGFTLIELMIVVAIIAILAVVAVPKFADLITKSKEATVKNALGALRSAITIYYSNINEYPGDLQTAIIGTNYFSEFPVLTIPKVPATSNPGHENVTGVKNIAIPDDDTATGVFAYAQGADQGGLHVNCTHRDAKGVRWSTY